MAASAREVFRQRALEAKIRQHVRAFEQEVVGTGIYWQFGTGQQKLLRLEMKMQVGDQTATLMQVCDREDLWIRKVLPPNPSRLEHVNLIRLRSTLMRLEEEGKTPLAENWILLGGLSRLIESLERNFEFSSPQAGQLGSLPVLVVRGEWKAGRRELLSKGGKEARQEQSAAEQIPSSVILTLGGKLDPLPLFPHRIEYLRKLTDQEKKQARDQADSAAAQETTLSTLEFYDVRHRPDLTPEQFEFNPGDEESDDRTQAYLRKLEP